MHILNEIYLNNVLKSQKKFFQSGYTLNYSNRILVLDKIYDCIKKYENDIAKCLQLDLGKHKQEAYSTEIGFILSEISHIRKNLKKWMKVKKVKSNLLVFLSKSYIIKQPYGTILIFSPYNYPFQLLFSPLISAISSGNCAIVCGSEYCIHTSKVIKKIINELFQEEYVCYVDGLIENCTKLLKLDVNKIFFTGSSNVGRIVMESASSRLIPITLELGGKSPVIICDNVNLKMACQRIVWGKFMNVGQTCVAPDYVFIKKSIVNNFLKILVETITEFYGNNIKENKDYGRIINAKHFNRLVNIIHQSSNCIIFGGNYDESNLYIEPTIIMPINKDTHISMQDEIFGPILPIIVYDDLQETIDFINKRPNPLALYIFSNDKREINHVIHSTLSGGVCINDTINHIINPNLPFGGVGLSGIGSYHGKFGFDTFSHSRAVLKKSTRFSISYPFPPFSSKKEMKIKKFMK